MQKKTLLSIVVCFTMTTLYAQKTEPADTLKGQTLDEVVVAQRRKLIKNDIDKLTYDVQHDKTAQTKTTLEILKKIPLVTVDGQENIRVQGSTSFKVYKNGHPDPSLSGQNLKDILKAIPASTIKRIEVITDPGAKYDAEGTTAILNIVMMSSSKLQGLSGNVDVSADHLGTTQFGTFLTSKFGKLTTSISFNQIHQNKRQSESDKETNYLYAKTGEQAINNVHYFTSGLIHMGDFSASYEIDSLNLLSTSVSISGHKADINTDGSTDRRDKNNQLIYYFNSKTSVPKNSDYSFGGRFDYEHKTHLAGEMLTISYMLAATRKHDIQRQEYSNQINMPVNYVAFHQDNHERFTENTFQIDYVRPFGGHHTLESGMKYILRDNSSRMLMDYQGAIPSVNSEFKHTMGITAAYLSYILKAGKWSGRAGLRYEHSYMKAEYPDGSNSPFHTNLNDWVPSVSVQYKINDSQTLKLSYSTSINRPGISYLNPAVISTPTTVSFGNANLISSRRQGLMLAYMLMTERLTLQLRPFYVCTNNGFTEVLYEQNRKDVSTYENVLKERAWGFNSYTQWNPFAGATLSLIASMADKRISIPSSQIINKGVGGEIYFSWEQELPWKLILEADVGGEYGNRIYNAYAIEGRYFFSNFALTRSFLKDKLTITIMADMPFRKYYTSTYRTVQGDYTGYERDVSNIRKFGIRLSWSFGKLKASVKRAARSIENDDLVGSKKK